MSALEATLGRLCSQAEDYNGVKPGESPWVDFRRSLQGLWALRDGGRRWVGASNGRCMALVESTHGAPNAHTYAAAVAGRLLDPNPRAEASVSHHRLLQWAVKAARSRKPRSVIRQNVPVIVLRGSAINSALLAEVLEAVPQDGPVRLRRYDTARLELCGPGWAAAIMGLHGDRACKFALRLEDLDSPRW